jgi:tetratricopeptide (TPR) repeat protein
MRISIQQIICTSHSIFCCCLLFASGQIQAKDESPIKGAPDAYIGVLQEAYENLQAGEIIGASEGFQFVLKADSQNLQAQLGMAMIFNKEKRFPEAFEAYDNLSKYYPQSAFVWNGRGLAAYNLENLTLALDSFKQASEMQPNGHHFESLAWTQMCLGEFEQAATNAKRASLFYSKEGQQSLYPLLIAYFSHLEAGDVLNAQRTLDYTLANLSNSAWPLPILRLIIGKVTVPELVSTVTNYREETEVHTYVGLHLRSIGKQEAAKKHLTWVRTKGDPTVFEYILARSLELETTVALYQTELKN